MIEENEEKNTFNPLADHVEKRTKENSIRSERLITDGLDILKDLMSRLLEVRPKELKQKKEITGAIKSPRHS